MVARRTVVHAIAASLVAARLTRAAEAPIEGAWTGILSSGSQRLRLRFVFESEKGRMFSIDQGGKPVAFEVIALARDDIRVRISTIRAEYRGRLMEPDRIDGEWKQGMTIPLRLFRGEAGFEGVDAEAKALDQKSL